MADQQRKISRSPRSPSVPLDEAIEKTARIYDREQRHPAPLDAVAKNLGYSGAKNGAAMATVASLRYYGLIERPNDGQIQVTKDYESYQFAPDDQLRRELRIKWLKAPAVFAELLEKFEGSLPSDATLKFTLIQRGFSPTAADECVTVFRRSVDFAGYYSEPMVAQEADEPAEPSAPGDNTAVTMMPSHAEKSYAPSAVISPGYDRIPVRLAGNRRAWLEIPSPFFDADKKQMKAQIDLLLTDDEVHEEGDEGA